MATGWPMKTTYANGDVYSASDVNDITGTINLLGSSVAYTAGKNKFINGDFGIWQRGTSLSLSAGNNYLADRWNLYLNAATVTCSRQTFTPGTAPVSGYEGTYFLRWAQTTGGSSTNQFQQRLEDVRLFAGQACTFSFWAKADSSMDVSLRWEQNFGSGGSADVKTTGSSVTLTTSWVRYSFTFTPTSVSGKTIGTNSYFSVGLLFNSAQTKTMDIWGCQLEQGSTATAFQTATGTIQGELAACQRYFESYKSSQNDSGIISGVLYANNSFIGSWNYSEKRIEPAFTVVNAGAFDIVFGGTVKDSTGLTITFSNMNKKWTQISVGSTGTPFTQGNGAVLRADLNFEIQINAEL